MLAGTQGVLATSTKQDTERVTARASAPRTSSPAATARRCPPGRRSGSRASRACSAAAGMVPTQVFLLGKGLTGWDAPWTAAGLDGADAVRTLDLGVRSGDLRDVRGTAVAVSRAVAAEGDVQVGDVLPARLEDTTAVSLRVAAIFDRVAGLGHVVIDRELARRHAAQPADTAVFVAGAKPAARPGTAVLTRVQYLDTVRALGQSGAWGVWVIIGLSIAFAALSLINTAAMATAERRGELATIRLLGGTGWQATRMVALELAPIVVVGLAAGGAVAALSLFGVSDGVRGIPVALSATLVGGLAAGAALLGLAAGAVTARKAVGVEALAAMRVKE